MEKKMKDKVEWFGEKGNNGVKVIKTAGKAIVVCVGLVVVGIALGAVGHAFGGGK
jgi:hypothetical protein